MVDTNRKLLKLLLSLQIRPRDFILYIYTILACALFYGIKRILLLLEEEDVFTFTISSTEVATQKQFFQ